MIKPMNKTITISETFIAPKLGADEAHVWHVNVEENSGDELRWSQLLSVDERQRASRFRFPRDQRRFTITRAWLRILLAGYLGSEAETLEFETAAHGKPRIAGKYATSPLEFNVSHSDEVALFGLTLGRAIGVDVERVRHDFEVAAIAKRFFSVAEQRAFGSLSPAHQHRAFFDCWTRKEAYVKAIGEGLSHPLHQFDVSLVPGEPAALVATRPDPMEAARWTMVGLELGKEYAAAVIVKAQHLQIQCRELPSLA